MKNQYEPLVTPAGWTGDEKRFAVRLTQILDELHTKLGNLKSTAGGKLDGGSVANTLDVTEEGHVLDARQGKALADRIAALYPVGSIYLSVAETDPGTFIGGTWTRLQDVFLLAGGETYEPGSTGGEAEVTLTDEQMPEHAHYGLYYAGNNTLVSMNDGTDGYKVSWTADAGTTEYSDFATGAAGEGEAHNNMPPYLAVYAWKRVE